MLVKLRILLVVPYHIGNFITAVQYCQLSDFQSKHFMLQVSQLRMLKKLLEIDELEGELLA